MTRTSAAILAVLTLLLVAAIAPGARAAAQDANGVAVSEQSLDEAAILGPPQGRALAGAELDARTRSLGERMRCPVCQGLSIAASPSASALSMMSQVHDLLARGYTDEQVLDYFVRSYGEFVLLEPTANGFNLVVWLLPLLVVLIGAALIAARIRHSRAHRDQAPSDEGERARDGGVRRLDLDDPELERYVERVRSEVGP